MSLETVVEEWLEERVAAEPAGQALVGVQVLDSAFGKITSNLAVMIGPAESNFAPTGPGAVGEYGGRVTLIILARVTGRTPAKFKEARELAASVAARIAYVAMFEDNDLGGRANDSLPGRYVRDFGTHDNLPYAIGNLPLNVNVAGQQLGGTR